MTRARRGVPVDRAQAGTADRDALVILARRVFRRPPRATFVYSSPPARLIYYTYGCRPLPPHAAVADIVPPARLSPPSAEGAGASPYRRRTLARSAPPSSG